MEPNTQTKRPEQPAFREDSDETLETEAAGLAETARSFAFRLSAAAVLAAAAVLLSLPEIQAALRRLLPALSSPYFGAACCGILWISGMLCPKICFGGILGLFRFRADTDALVSMNFYFAFLYGVCLIAFGGGPNPLVPAAALSIVFALLSKLLDARRALRSLRLLSSSPAGFRAAAKVCDGRATAFFAPLLGLRDAVICNPQKAVFLDGFSESAFARSAVDRLSRALAPAVLLFAAAAAVLSWRLHGPAGAAAAFAVTTALGIPLTGALGASLPMMRASARLRKKQALLAGCGTVDDFADVNAFVLDMRSIYPEGTVAIAGIRPVSGRSADGAFDDAVIDAASLACAAGGTLGDAFLAVTGAAEALRPAEGLEYVDGRGLCGWVNSHRVLLGSRELMRQYGIDMPSRYTEARALSGGADVVYLAVAGELSAIILIRYTADRVVARALRRLQKLGVSLLVFAKDPNITAEGLAERFGLNDRQIKILDRDERELLPPKAENGHARAGLAFLGGAASYASAVTACIKLRGTMNAAAAIQTLSAAMGAFLGLFLAFSHTSAQVTALQVLVFQAVWSAPVLLLAAFRRH